MKNNPSYGPLNYIRFTGTQCLVFDYYTNPNTHIEIDMQFQSNGNASATSGVGNSWIGSYEKTVGMFQANFGGAANQYGYIYYWFENPYVSSTWYKNYGSSIYNHGIWIYNNNQVKFLNSTTTTETKTTTQDGKLMLGGSKNSSSSALSTFSRHNLYIFSVKIYDGNTLMLDLTPMSYGRTNGLYDSINDKFYTSITSSNLDGRLGDYVGFFYGRIYSSTATVNSVVLSGTATGSKISPIYQCVAGHVIAFNYDPQGRTPKDAMGSDYGECSMIQYNSSGNKVSGSFDGGRTAAVKHVATIASTATTFRVTTHFALDDFYIYDRTDGVYIFKGKNITETSQ